MTRWPSRGKVPTSPFGRQYGVSTALSARVFSAGGHCFTWAEVVGFASARGEWAALERRVVALLVREQELAAAGALPDAATMQAAADSFRDRYNVLTADELEQWLARNDVSLQEWKGEMRAVAAGACRRRIGSVVAKK